MRRFAKITVVAIALGALGSGLGTAAYIRFNNPFPPIAADLPNVFEAAEREFAARVSHLHLEILSQEELTLRLRELGWPAPQTYRQNHWYVMRVRVANLFAKEIVTILWQVREDGKVEGVRGTYDRSEIGLAAL